MICRMDFDMFFMFFFFEFLTQSEDFAKAIAFARLRILKMVSFVVYLVLFGAVFSVEQL